MKNVERLGNLLKSEMKQTAKGNKDIFTELGTIQKNKSLKISSVRNPIPAGQYMVTRAAKEEGLSSGDRVVVIWVGFEPIVLDVVSSS